MTKPTPEKKRVGLAFQGGVIPAGSFAAGVVRALVDAKAFDQYDVVAFSGTSAGALVASVCWGYTLEGKMNEAPDVLRRQWMDIAYGTVPNAQVADLFMLADHLARMNPVYDAFQQNVFVPFVRDQMKAWARRHIDFEKWIKLFQSSKFDDKESQYGCSRGLETGRSPGLFLGTTDVLEGEVKVIDVLTEEDFTLETVLASGSLDESNGMTIIRKGPHEGVYIDGAWAVNPPISEMIDCGVDEIWLVRVFPKTRETIPGTPGERKDRRDELWQNSLVEHELDKIEFVNKWLEALNKGIDAGIKAADYESERKRKHFKPITVEVIPMERDLPAKAAMVNAASFIQDMMDYGYHQAHRFMLEKDEEEKKAA
jgi:NTE family protein